MQRDASEVQVRCRHRFAATAETARRAESLFRRRCGSLRYRSCDSYLVFQFIQRRHRRFSANSFLRMQLPELTLPFFYLTFIRPLLHHLNPRISAGVTGMRNDPNLFVGDARHRALVDVNEEGTEAVAATYWSGLCGSAPAPPPPELRCDRPFMFLIRSRRAQLEAVHDVAGDSIIYFMGKFACPP